MNLSSSKKLMGHGTSCPFRTLLCLQLGPASHEVSLCHIGLQKKHLAEKLRQSFEHSGVLKLYDSSSESW